VRGVNPEFIVALIAASLAVATLALVPYQVPGETLAAIGNLESPAFFPIIAGGLMGICAVLLAVNTIASERAGRGLRLTFEQPRTVLLVIATYIGLLLGAHYVGLIASSAVAIVLMAWGLGYRNLKILIAVAAMVPACIYLLFQKGLLVVLPGGVLFQ
jgi:Tripartite tricarboxylate transporter TctB family